MTEQHRVTSHTTVRIKDLTYEASHNGGISDIITNTFCIHRIACVYIPLCTYPASHLSTNPSLPPFLRAVFLQLTLPPSSAKAFPTVGDVAIQLLRPPQRKPPVRSLIICPLQSRHRCSHMRRKNLCGIIYMYAHTDVLMYLCICNVCVIYVSID